VGVVAYTYTYWHVCVLTPGYFVWPCSPHIHRTEFVTSHNEQKESFQQYFYTRYKIVVYTGLRNDSIKNHASRNEARRIAAMRIIFTRINCILFTCNMYMCHLKHINDPVLSSLKMEGIYFFFVECLMLKIERPFDLSKRPKPVAPRHRIIPHTTASATVPPKISLTIRTETLVLYLQSFGVDGQVPWYLC
jgi:hypothetical protein